MTPAERIKSQYIRLLNAYGNMVVFVSIPDIADTLYCSPGHARVLLQEMRKNCWVSWVSHSGRGAKGQLQCLYSITRLSAEQVTNNNSKSTVIIENAEIISPPLVLDMEIYRPVSLLSPSLFSGRLERHLFRMIHGGLLRYVPESQEPVADLAHYWSPSEDNLSWRFYLRQGTKWHNGEIVSEQQVITQIKRIISRKDLIGIFSHVISVNIIRPFCIEFNLSRADALFAHRLANPICALPHPDNDNIGVGPFYIVKQTAKEFHFKRWDNYHNSYPFVHEVRYKTVPDSNLDWSTYELNVKNTSMKGKMSTFKKSSSFTFLMFNYKESPLSDVQCQFIRILARAVTSSFLKSTRGICLPEERWLAYSAERWIHGEITLPDRVSVGYYYTPHTELFVNELAKKIAYFNCKFVLTPIASRDYPTENIIAKQDIIIGDFIPGENLTVSMEGMFRSSPVAYELLPEDTWIKGIRILNIASSRLSQHRYERKISSFASWILKNHVITPLFSHEYIISAPETIRDIFISNQGFPDYRTIWFE